MSKACPYNIGDVVRFTPSERTKGLCQHFERFGLAIGKELPIREIRDEMFLYFDNGAGGFAWVEFSPVEEAKASINSKGDWPVG